MVDKNIENPSVLAFDRKLDPSDAVFHSGGWEDRNNAARWEPVKLREKSVRGTASHRMKVKKGADPTKLDMKFESPNPQLVDVAALPADKDTLKVTFTVRVLAGTGTPSACNNATYRDKLLATVAGYVTEHGFTTLATRYASNLANGRFLWRNRMGAESVEVRVAQLENGHAKQAWTFDALDLRLHDFDHANTDIADLAQVITQGLTGDTHVLLQVTAFVRAGAGQEVFPSQELILDRGRGDKSKTLYDVDGVAAIHSQKIGNALRTIDTWYPEASVNGPIAVEPYGSVTTQGRAYRQPKEKQDFYNLLDGWIIKDKTPDVDQQHFVIATLIRGGVFGEAG